MNTVLVVDDDERLRKQVYWALKDSYRVFQAEDRLQTHQIMEEAPVDLVLLDLRLPPAVDTPEEGMKTLEEIRRVKPEIKIIVITADKKEETCLRAIKNGAYDYISKPFDLGEMRIVVKRALYRQNLEREIERLRLSSEEKYEFANMVGKSEPMRKIFEMIGTLAQADCTVLLRGDSGTGKELVARAIHYNSSRMEKTFVPVNCAALPEALLESELFGYEKGAFTGAATRKLGKFEVASGGTIFLDEIADMSLPMQAKILRVVQEQSFERVGGTKSVKVDFRLITATNKDLEKAMAKGLFREDLYHRLNVVTVHLPPLRQRKEDIPLLVNYFLKRYNRLNGEKVRTISAEALDLLMDYEWPGNVRELENVVERAVVLTNNDVILPEDILLRPGKRISDSEIISPPRSILLVEVEKVLIQKALKTTHWNQTKAAKLLGIHRNTLRRKIKYFKIDEEQEKFSIVGSFP